MIRNLSAILILVSASFAHALPERAVEWGGNPRMDACDGFGIVLVNTVLFQFDGSSGSMKHDSVIPAGKTVSYCDEDGEYTGVLIHERGVDCGGGSAGNSVRSPYTGPCQSGWIKSIFLELVNS